MIDYKSLLYFTPGYSMCIRFLFSKRRKKFKTNSQWNILLKLFLKVKKPYFTDYSIKRNFTAVVHPTFLGANLRRQYQTPNKKYIHQYTPGKQNQTPIYTRKIYTKHQKEPGNIYTNIHQENKHQLLDYCSAFALIREFCFNVLVN